MDQQAGMELTDDNVEQVGLGSTSLQGGQLRQLVAWTALVGTPLPALLLCCHSSWMLLYCMARCWRAAAAVACAAVLVLALLAVSASRCRCDSRVALSSRCWTRSGRTSSAPAAAAWSTWAWMAPSAKCASLGPQPRCVAFCSNACRCILWSSGECQTGVLTLHGHAPIHD